MTLEITLLLHLHNLDGVLLRDVAGGRAEHVTTPRGSPLAGRAGGRTHCAGGRCRFSETGLDILTVTVPGAGDTAVTELSVVTVLEEETEGRSVMAVVSIPGEPLTARSIPAPSLQVNDY